MDDDDEKEENGLAIAALQLIIQQQRALKGSPRFDEATWTIAYFVLSHSGKLYQDLDPKIQKMILEAITGKGES